MTPQTATAPGWRLSELLADLASPPVTDDLLIEHLALKDSDCGPGVLFLAYRGTAADQLHDAERAVTHGCPAVALNPEIHGGRDATVTLSSRLGVPVIAIVGLGERAGTIAARFYGDPCSALTVIGIIGQRPATSLAHLIAQALADERCGSMSSLGTGFVHEFFDCDPITADPLRTHAQLARLRSAGARSVTAEVTPGSLLSGAMDGVQPGILIFSDHPPAANGADGVTPALQRLAAQPGLRWAVFNRDEPNHRFIEPNLGQAVARAGYSLMPGRPLDDCDCWVRATRIECTADGLALDVETSAGCGSVQVPLIGRCNASNVLAVISVLLAGDRDLRTTLGIVARLQGVPGRLERFTAPNSPLVVVDSADTPSALETAIHALRDHRDGRVITVFGCSGGDDPAQRPLMGSTAERLSDQLIVSDNNPRGEDGEAIIKDIAAGICAQGKLIVERQRALAIRRAIALAGREDMVLVAGKGHETIQDMGELKVRFSDRAQAVQALSERRGPLL